MRIILIIVIVNFQQKCGVIEDAQKIRIDSSPLHCPVCMSVFNKAPEILPCGHSHCVDCLDKLKNYTLRANQEIGNRVGILILTIVNKTIFIPGH
jgi:hypothetical protein